MMQAEDFDNGGQGVAYNDTTAANEGNSYRTGERVDVQPATDAWTLAESGVIGVGIAEGRRVAADPAAVATGGRYRARAVTVAPGNPIDRTHPQ